MSLSELWSLYGQNYIDALLATWGMTLESFAIAMVLAVAVTVMRVSPLNRCASLATCMFRSSVTSRHRAAHHRRLCAAAAQGRPSLPHLRYRRHGPFGLSLWLRELMSGINTVARSGRSRPLAGHELQPYPRQDRDSAGAAFERAAHDQPLYRRHAHHRARQSGAT